MADKSDTSISASAVAVQPLEDKSGTKSNLYDDEEFAQYFQPIEKFEGRHRIDRTATWEPKEEKVLVRKIDKWILPWTCLMFMCMQLDRGNISQFDTLDYRTHKAD